MQSCHFTPSEVANFTSRNLWQLVADEKVVRRRVEGEGEMGRREVEMKRRRYQEKRRELIKQLCSASLSAEGQ